MRYIFSLALSIVVAGTLSGCLYHNFGGGIGDESVALINVKGMIVEPDKVVEDLEKARKDNDIKAIVVRVDSPGGSVGASQEIFRAIRQIDKEKPVIASMGDVAASGGYYVSAAARKIFANEGTVTGSIGVIMEHVNASGFFDLIRLKPEVLKSGAYKDVGSVFRAMTPEERAYLKGFLKEVHEQFKADVASARHLDMAFVNKIANGKIYTGQRAIALGLVDQIGGLPDAIKAAAEAAGIKGEPNVIKIRKPRPWWYDMVTDKFDSALEKIVGKVAYGYKYFMYEWKPY